MEINGLPLHPLVVHAAVVFGPLAAVSRLSPTWCRRGAIGCAGRWSWRVVVAVGAHLRRLPQTGEDFRESKEFFNQAPLSDQIDKHEDLAETLRLAHVRLRPGRDPVRLAAHARSGLVRIALNVLLAGVRVAAVVVYVIRTGDAGAQAVWGS